MTVTPLRIAVVGAGVMGANHARIVTGSPIADLVAVVDQDRDRGTAAADRAGAAVLSSLDELFDDAHRPDAVVVATPTATHADLAARVLEAGLPVLVEKPIAATVPDAEALVALASDRELVLTVGHVERCNPVVRELLAHRDPILHVEAHRVGPFAARIPDSVVNDLMIHDLDIVRALVRSELVEVAGVAQSRRTDTEDMVTAVLGFENGATAAVTASRLGQQKIRQLQLTTEEAFVVGDLLRQDITVTRVQHTEYVSDDGSRYRQTASVEIPFLDNRGEPLGVQLDAFVRAITDGTPPAASGEDGVAALRMVEQVLAAVR